MCQKVLCLVRTKMLNAAKRMKNIVYIHVPLTWVMMTPWSRLESPFLLSSSISCLLNLQDILATGNMQKGSYSDFFKKRSHVYIIYQFLWQIFLLLKL